MFSRIRKRPSTFQMLQEKNAVNAAVKQAAAKKAAAKKRVSSKIQQLKGVRKPVKKQGTAIKQKTVAKPDVKDLLKTIPGKNFVKNGLLYLYKSKLTTKEAIKNFTTKRNDNELRETLNQQVGVIQKHHYPPINIMNSNTVRSTRFNLNGDNKINLVYLIWLDAIHDGYISGDNLFFTNFMKSGMIELLGFKISNFKMTDLMYEVKKITEGKWFSYKVNNGKITDIEKMKTKKGTISLGYEAILKRNLKILFDFDSDIQEFAHNDIKFNKKPREVVYVGIDQENSNQKSLSTVVTKSKFENRNGATWKQLQPYLTISNLTDPGIHMTLEGWGVDKVYLFPENKSKPPRSREAWNFRLQQFILGKTVITMKFDDVNNVYKTQINNETINTTASARNAKKANNASTGLSKFFGDFLQVLTMASYVNGPIALGTGDGMMAVIYCFITKQLLEKEPKLVLDLSTNTKVQFIGLNNILQAKTSASEPTGVYIHRGNNNNNNNVSSVRSNSNTNTNTNLGTRITAPQNPVINPKRPRNNNGTNGRNNTNLGTRITAPQNPVINPKRPRNNNGTNGRNNTNLGTRITAPQNPVINPKRPRNNNGTNGRRVTRSRTPAK